MIQLLTTCLNSPLPFTPLFSALATWLFLGHIRHTQAFALAIPLASCALLPGSFQVVFKCHFLSVAFCSNLFKISATYLSPACCSPSLLCYFLALITDTDYITLSHMKLSIFDLIFNLNKWSVYMAQPTILLYYFDC